MTALLLCGAVGALAQPPQTINIQGALENSAGAPVTGTRAYRVRFFDASSGGNQIGSDATGTVTLSDAGRFNIELTPPDAVLSTAQSWYELAIDTDGVNGVGSNDIFPQRAKIHSVPFALLAEDAVNGGGGTTPTLDLAYDGGGAGAGRTIEADSGSVLINGSGGIESAGPIDTADRVRVRDGLSGNADATLSRETTGGRLTMTDEVNVQTILIGAEVAGGFAHIFQANNQIGLELDGDRLDGGAGGEISLRNGAGNEVFFASATNGSDGQTGVRNAAGNSIVFAAADTNDAGFLGVYRSSGSLAATVEVNNTGSGLVTANNSSGVRVALVSDNVANGGFVGVQNPNGVVVASLTTTGSGGNQSGFVSVRDGFNNPRAGIDGSNGEVFGDIKAFVVPDPRRAGGMIRYASLEGPEAALYVRGKARLENGQAQVTFPEHFALLAAPESITVSLTPRSRASKGLAAESVSPTGLSVAELHGGTGVYEFDYFVCAVRKGHENFEVYVDAQRYQSLGSSVDQREAPLAPPAPAP
jgi:hypothetical protein